MPRVTETLVELMRRKGYVHITEARTLTGHADSTIYGWVERGHLAHTKSGGHMFFDRRGLEVICPHILVDVAMRGGRSRERRVRP